MTIVKGKIGPINLNPRVSERSIVVDAVGDESSVAITLASR